MLILYNQDNAYTEMSYADEVKQRSKLKDCRLFQYNCAGHAFINTILQHGTWHKGPGLFAMYCNNATLGNWAFTLVQPFQSNLNHRWPMTYLNQWPKSLTYDLLKSLTYVLLKSLLTYMSMTYDLFKSSLTYDLCKWHWVAWNVRDEMCLTYPLIPRHRGDCISVSW